MLVVQVRTSTSWLVTWAVLAALPFLPFTAPLVHSALAATPAAYLVWVVPLAFVWAVDNLRRLPPYRRPGAPSAWAGGLLMLAAGSAAVLAPRLWPFTFQADSLPLLLWPVWALGLAWLWFGAAVTRAVWAPLTFLLLAWPPLLTAAGAAGAAALLPLDRATLVGLALVAPHLLSVTAGAAPLLRVAATGHHAATLSLAAACSGADSLIAVLVFAPFVLSRTGGAGGAGRILLVALGAVLAFAMNLARLVVLVLLVYAWGAPWALAWPHALLGVALFTAVAVLLVRLAGALRLLPVEPPPGDDTVALPPPARTLGAAAASVLALGLLATTAAAPPGALGAPEAVPALVPIALLPVVPGYRLTVLDNAGVLGGGLVQRSAPSAVGRYTAPGGRTVAARVWLTPRLAAIGPYAYGACLMCGAQAPAMRRALTLQGGTPAAAFLLPEQEPLALDVEWTAAVVADGARAYLHVALTAEAGGLRPSASAARPAAVPFLDRLDQRPATGAVGGFPRVLRPVWRGLVPFAQAFDRGERRGALL